MAKLNYIGSNFIHLAKVLATTNSEPGLALKGADQTGRMSRLVCSFVHMQQSQLSRIEAQIENCMFAVYSLLNYLSPTLNVLLPHNLAIFFKKAPFHA